MTAIAPISIPCPSRWIFFPNNNNTTKRTVILSDFLESGRDEKELYATIAQALGQKQVNRLIGIGPAHRHACFRLQPVVFRGR